MILIFNYALTIWTSRIDNFDNDSLQVDSFDIDSLQVGSFDIDSLQVDSFDNDSLQVGSFDNDSLQVDSFVRVNFEISANVGQVCNKGLFVYSVDIYNGMEIKKINEVPTLVDGSYMDISKSHFGKGAVRFIYNGNMISKVFYDYKEINQESEFLCEMYLKLNILFKTTSRRKDSLKTLGSLLKLNNKPLSIDYMWVVLIKENVVFIGEDRQSYFVYLKQILYKLLKDELFLHLNEEDIYNLPKHLRNELLLVNWNMQNSLIFNESEKCFFNIFTN